MKKTLLMSGVALLVMAGCTHNDGPVIGGRGGNVTLAIRPAHHQVAKNITSFTAYIKYNVTDAPANGVYDDSVAGVAAGNKITCTFTGLLRGNYYIYGRGTDTSIQQTVKGGIPVSIKNEGIQDVDLPVSED